MRNDEWLKALKCRTSSGQPDGTYMFDLRYQVTNIYEM